MTKVHLAAHVFIYTLVLMCADELAMMQQRMMEIQQLLASQVATTTATASPQPSGTKTKRQQAATAMTTVSRQPALHRTGTKTKSQQSRVKGMVLGIEGESTLLTCLRLMHLLANSTLVRTLVHCAFLQYTQKAVVNVPFHTAPTLWNYLSKAIRNSESALSFKSALKTYLFQLYN